MLKRYIIYSLFTFGQIILLQSQEISSLTEYKFLKVTDISTSLNSIVVSVASGKKIDFFEVLSKNKFLTLENGISQNILSLGFSADSTRLISGGENGQLLIWDLKTRVILDEFNYHSAPILSVAISPDSRYYCAGDAEGNIMLLDAYNNNVINIPETDRGEITCLTFMNHSDCIIWGSSTGRINMFNIATRTLKPFPHGHNKWVRTLSLSVNDDILITGGDDRRLLYWINDNNNFNILMVEGNLSRITATNIIAGNKGYAFGTLSGMVKCKINNGSAFRYKCKEPIRKIESFTDHRNQTYLIIAIWGRGIQILPLAKMKAGK